MAKHTARDYQNMTIEEMVAVIAEDAAMQRTYTKGNYQEGEIACSCAGAFEGNNEK